MTSRAPVLAYLVSVTGYGLIAGNEVVPGESKVQFEEAIQAWGLLLDRHKMETADEWKVAQNGRGSIRDLRDHS
jgi:hypothetical protein